MNAPGDLEQEISSVLDVHLGVRAGAEVGKL